MRHYFLSYTRKDAEHARWLQTSLESADPDVTIHVDRSDIPAVVDWRQWIADTIPRCAALLFVMTRRSVGRRWTGEELTLAENSNVPILLLKFDDTDNPVGFSNRGYVDFRKGHRHGLSVLRQELDRLEQSGAGSAAAKRRVEEDRSDTFTVWDEPVSNPSNSSIQRREPSPLVVAGPARHGPLTTRVTAVNLPADVDGFQNRTDQTKALADLIRSEGVRLILVVGVPGIGKTAVVRRLLRAIDNGEKLGEGPLDVRGLLYLTANGGSPLTTSTLLTDMSRLLPADAVARLQGLLLDVDVPLPERLRALAQEFRDRRVLVVIDDFEKLLDLSTRDLRDPKLKAVIEGLLDLSHHGIKVILSTVAPPDSLWRGHVGKLQQVSLDGLPSPFAEEFLRAQDRDGSTGLKHASRQTLTRARERTRGHPRALEALAMVLAQRAHASLDDLLQNIRLEHNIAEELVGRSLEFLDRAERRVLEALAIYGSPVPPSAIDELLYPYLNGISCGPPLGNLVRLRLAARCDLGELERIDGVTGGESLFELHLADRDYLLDSIDRGSDTDLADEGTFTQIALFRRGADYFRRAQLPTAQQKELMDLRPQLAEIDLRIRAGDHDDAVDVLYEIASEQLFTWGNADVVLYYLQRLEGQVQDPERELALVGMLGTAYQLLADYRQAIGYFDRALALARQLDDQGNVLRATAAIAGCHYSLGEVSDAADAYQRVLEEATVARQRAHNEEQEPELLADQASALIGLGLCLSEEGRFSVARRQFEHARELLRRLKEPRMLTQWHVNFGRMLLELGHAELAQKHFNAGMLVAQGLGYRQGEGRCLIDMARARIDLDDPARALGLLETGLRIGREISNRTLQRDANYVGALAWFCMGELDSARRAIDDACRASTTEFHHSTFALQGLVALKQDDRKTALKAFGTARSHAANAHARNRRDYLAWDTSGLAAAGSVFLLVDDVLHREAIAAYRKARRISSEDGVVAHAMRLLQGVPDPDGLLADVCLAASGRSSQHLGQGHGPT